ncbi:hypothetical protein [Sorangium sp. So ce131]|uniref:hypothetical protein n=1 Tax=Sorangium sp. So ce131 TaxID=3133282 RepID=UPI003F614754
MLELLRNDHFTVTVDAAAKLARITRTTEPFRSPEELEEKWLEVSRALVQRDRRELSLLVDVRASPGRNEPAYEAAMLRMRPVVMRGFRRVALLVSSQIGALQLLRHVREDGIDRMISHDEGALLAYLADAPPGSR